MLFGEDDINEDNVDDIRDFTQVSPEKVLDYEAGIQYNTTDINVQLNGFTMLFENEIAAIGQLSMIGLPLRKNVDDSRRTGLELDFNWRVSNKITLENNTTYMTANIEEYTTDFDGMTYTDVVPLLTPNWIVNTTLRYRIGTPIELSLTSKYVGESYLDNENTVMMPSYFIWNFGFIVHVLQHSVDFRVNNLTDRLYFSGGYVGEPGVPHYYVQAPMNFVGTIYLRF
jgi:iron complex outermembrane receptor protein